MGESSSLSENIVVLEEAESVLYTFNVPIGDTERVQNRRALAWSSCSSGKVIS